MTITVLPSSDPVPQCTADIAEMPVFDTEVSQVASFPGGSGTLATSTQPSRYRADDGTTASADQSAEADGPLTHLLPPNLPGMARRPPSAGRRSAPLAVFDRLEFVTSEGAAVAGMTLRVGARLTMTDLPDIVAYNGDARVKTPGEVRVDFHSAWPGLPLLWNGERQAWDAVATGWAGVSAETVNAEREFHRAVLAIDVIPRGTDTDCYVEE